MAAPSPARALQEELFCPVCLDYFTEPVVLNCEHNFCRACISTYWDSLEGSRFPCPQCRKRCHGGKFRPNVHLGRVAERAKELAWATTASPARRASRSSACPASSKHPEKVPEEKCQRHQEALKLFCKEDQALICVVCDRSREHRQHTVIPVEEAAEEYKVQLHQHLAILKSERDSREILALNHGKKLDMLMSRAEAEKQRTADAFQQLRKSLQDRESYILQGLSKAIKDLKKMQQANNSKVQQGAPLLQGMIVELEQKCQQPDTVFLKDAGSLLNRCKGWNFPKWTPMSTTSLEEQISHFSHKKKFLWEHMTEMQGPITAEGATKIRPPIQWIFEMKTNLPASAEGDSSISLRTMPCANSTEYGLLFTTTVTTIDKASGTTIVAVGVCSTITLKIILGDGAAARELEGPSSREGPIHTATVGAESVTTQNGVSAADPERDTSFLQQLSSDTEDASSTRKPQNVTLLSAGKTIGGTGGTIDPSVYEETSTHAVAMDFQNATSPPQESSGNVQGNSATCYLNCETFPAWATSLLCMATGFLVFMLVGLLFLIPYCIKLRKPAVMLYSTSPPYNA